MFHGGILPLLCYCIHYGNLFKETYKNRTHLLSVWESGSSSISLYQSAGKPERNPNLCAPDEVINNLARRRRLLARRK